LRPSLGVFRVLSLLFFVAVLFVPVEWLTPGVMIFVRVTAAVILGFLVLFYGPGEALHEYILEAGGEFYRLDRSATIDRAFRELYSLHRNGADYLKSPPAIEAWHEWDKRVRHKLVQRCAEGALLNYLGNTGRLSAIDAPLRADKVVDAVGFLDMILKEGLDWSIRWP
jgi:hypothetical protein